MEFPDLHTQRLTLRGPQPQDFDAVASFFADKDRSSGFGGPMTRDNAWRWFATSLGHWHLRGYGFWTVELTQTGQICGIVGLWNPEGWPEPELGWVMFEGAEGKGIAHEAATEVRRYAYAVLDFPTLTSNIVPGNERSIALAKRLGATHERTYENPHMGTEHMFRHPGPEALT